MKKIITLGYLSKAEWGGQSRCVTTLDNLAIVEVVYEEDCNPRRIQQ